MNSIICYQVIAHQRNQPIPQDAVDDHDAFDQDWWELYVRASAAAEFVGDNEYSFHSLSDLLCNCCYSTGVRL
jgi:hypothetical protein